MYTGVGSNGNLKKNTYTWWVERLGETLLINYLKVLELVSKTT